MKEKYIVNVNKNMKINISAANKSAATDMLFNFLKSVTLLKTSIIDEKLYIGDIKIDIKKETKKETWNSKKTDKVKKNKKETKKEVKNKKETKKETKNSIWDDDIKEYDTNKDDKRSK